MTETKRTTLAEYNQEIQPKLRSMFKKQEILKEWAADDEQVQEYKREIKALQEVLKSYIEEVESELTREINDIKTDVKLAVKAAAKSSGYKAAELNAYFNARAKDKVDDVLHKADLFTRLHDEIV